MIQTMKTLTYVVWEFMSTKWYMFAEMIPVE
jgi:hypothetical protein